MFLLAIYHMILFLSDDKIKDPDYTQEQNTEETSKSIVKR